MRRAFGTILPSSNRVVERATIAALRHLGHLDGCFARIPFHGAGLGQPADGYDPAPYEAAAAQLAHAQVGAVCWNGTRGAALGLAHDRGLVAAMAAQARAPATTTALATAELLRRLNARRLAMVGANDTGSLHAAAEGLGGVAVAAHGFGLTDNLASAAIAPAAIADAARGLAGAKPEAVLIWSTNLEGFPVVPRLEAELGIPVICSASAGVWAVLEAMGEPRAPARALGRIFDL